MGCRIANWKEPEIERKIRAEALKRAWRAGFVVERAVKKMIKGSGKPHKPSLPGEPPKLDTGRLRAGYSTNATSGPARAEIKNPAPTSRPDDGVGNPGGDENTIHCVVGTNVPHAKWMEFGTEDGHVAARPHLRPALHQSEEKIKQIFRGRADFDYSPSGSEDGE